MVGCWYALHWVLLYALVALPLLLCKFTVACFSCVIREVLFSLSNAGGRCVELLSRNFYFPQDWCMTFRGCACVQANRAVHALACVD